jgi:hypothetical protein
VKLVEGLDRRCADRAGGLPGLRSARHAPSSDGRDSPTRVSR